MKHFELSGTIREVGNKAVIKAFRKQGLVPCNLYGLGLKNVLFTVSDRDLQGLLCTPESFIVDLNLSDGKKYLAIVHELQFHPVKDNCLHVDFLAVDDKKPITINVPLVFQGHPVGVQKGGKFFKLARELRISAQLEDLPDNLVIDINKLDIEKKLTAGDLSYDKVTILTWLNLLAKWLLMPQGLKLLKRLQKGPMLLLPKLLKALLLLLKITLTRKNKIEYGIPGSRIRQHWSRIRFYQA